MSMDLDLIATDPKVRERARMRERERKRTSPRGQVMYAIHQRVHKEDINDATLDWIAFLLYIDSPPLTHRSTFWQSFRRIATMLIERGVAKRFAVVLKNVVEEAEEAAKEAQDEASNTR